MVLGCFLNHPSGGAGGPGGGSGGPGGGSGGPGGGSTASSTTASATTAASTTASCPFKAPLPLGGGNFIFRLPHVPNHLDMHWIGQVNIPLVVDLHVFPDCGFPEVFDSLLRPIPSWSANSFFAMIMFVQCVLACLLYTSPSPRDRQKSRMPSSA